MQRLTQKEIEEINKQYNLYSGDSEQGIYVQPYGIPIHIKEPVIYCRYETGGYTGGSYHEDSYARPYEKEPPKDKMKILEIVLEKIKPNISFLQYKQIDRLIHTNSETEYEYYGNSTNWEIEYIILSDLYKYLESI